MSGNKVMRKEFNQKEVNSDEVETRSSADKRQYKTGSNKRNNKRTRKPATKNDSRISDINASRSSEGGRVHKLNNDPSWYFTDPTLMEQVSSFSFNQFLSSAPTFTEIGLRDMKVPYAMRIAFNPCPGWSAGNYGEAGINVAAMKLYTKLSSGNSKNTNYAPQDLSTLMLALGEVISFSEFGRRALGLAFTYNKRNWAYPKSIIRVAGFDPDDLLSNLAKYRMQFNATVNSINQITFPADVPYFQKCGYMYSHIWLDSESPMAQSYVYIPASVWYIDETSYDQGTILKTIPIFNGLDGKTVSNGYTSFEAYLTMLQNMIQRILNSATFQYIYADVLRLFDSGGYLTIPFLSEDYIVLPEYDPMALLQIDNATLFSSPIGTTFDEERTPSNDVYPKVDTNALVYMPQWDEKNSLIPFTPKLINFPHSMGNPDVTQRIEATRFTMILDSEGSDDSLIYKDCAMPDHYPVSISIWDDDVKWSTGNCWTYNDSTERAEFIGYLNKFSHAPRLYVASDGTRDAKVTTTTGDLDFFTTIDHSYLKRVNDLAFTNLFSL